VARRVGDLRLRQDARLGLGCRWGRYVSGGQRTSCGMSSGVDAEVYNLLGENEALVK